MSVLYINFVECCSARLKLTCIITLTRIYISYTHILCIYTHIILYILRRFQLYMYYFNKQVPSTVCLPVLGVGTEPHRREACE